MYNDELTHYAISKSRDSQYAVAYDDEYLEHYGKKGMKWGVRNEPETTGTRRKKGLSKGAKVALGVGAGILGTAAVGAVGYKYGPGAIKSMGHIAKSMQLKSTFKQYGGEKPLSRKTAINQMYNKHKKAKKIWGGLKDVAAKTAKELKSTDTAAEWTASFLKKSGKEILVGGGSAAVTGGTLLAVRSAIKGEAPTRQEMASWMTENPNKKKK